MAWSGMTLGRERKMNSWLIGSRRCGAVVTTMAATAMYASIAPSSHCFPQMCAVLQPLHDNMAQSSSFVQVCFSFHALFHYVSVILLLPICQLHACTSAVSLPLQPFTRCACRPSATSQTRFQRARAQRSRCVSKAIVSICTQINMSPRRKTPTCICAAALA
jgi:hypothetical protein